MKRPYLVYFAGVVLPCTFAAVLGLLAVHSGWADLQSVSYGRVGRMALAASALDSAGAGAVVSRVTGYEVTLYPRATAPTVIPPAVLATAPDGGDLMVRVAPRGTPASVVPPSLLLAGVLLLVFSALAGWIQLTGRRTPSGALGGGVMVVLLSLVPALSTGALLVELDGALRSGARELTNRDLTRGLAVAGALGDTHSARTVHDLSGFGATHLVDHAVLETTLPGGAAALAAIVPPPPRFTSTGSVEVAGTRLAYLAVRPGKGELLVLTTPPPEDRLATFRRRAVFIAAGLATWLLVLGVAVWKVRRS